MLGVLVSAGAAICLAPCDLLSRESNLGQAINAVTGTRLWALSFSLLRNGFVFMQLLLGLSRFPASRLQSQIAAYVAAFAKEARIFQRQHEGQRDQGTYTLDLFQQRHLRITLLRQFLDALVVFGDALANRFNGREQWLQGCLQFRTQALGFFRIHVAHITAAQSFAVALA